MHLGKHQEYEKKLHEGLLSRAAVAAAQVQANGGTVAPPTNGSPPVQSQQNENGSSGRQRNGNGTANGSGGGSGGDKDNWPTLSSGDTTPVNNGSAGGGGGGKTLGDKIKGQDGLKALPGEVPCQVSATVFDFVFFV